MISMLATAALLAGTAWPQEAPCDERVADGVLEFLEKAKGYPVRALVDLRSEDADAAPNLEALCALDGVLAAEQSISEAAVRQGKTPSPVVPPLHGVSPGSLRAIDSMADGSDARLKAIVKERFGEFKMTDLGKKVGSWRLPSKEIIRYAVLQKGKDHACVPVMVGTVYSHGSWTAAESLDKKLEGECRRQDRSEQEKPKDPRCATWRGCAQAGGSLSECEACCGACFVKNGKLRPGYTPCNSQCGNLVP